LALTVPFTALAATGKAARKARPIGGIFWHDLKKRRKKNIQEAAYLEGSWYVS
jgi:hypothetical protein